MKQFGLLFSVFLAIFSPFSASAASVIPMSLDEMVTNADTIAIARCIEINSYWKDNKIYTDQVMAVEQKIKGEEISPYVITTLGGTAMHPRLKVPVNMAVPGGASFQLNEEVLVFTRMNIYGINQVVGFTQGKFTIETDSASGKKVIPIGQKKVTGQPSDVDVLTLLFSPVSFFEPHQSKIQVRNIELSEIISKIVTRMADQ